MLHCWGGACFHGALAERRWDSSWTFCLGWRSLSLRASQQEELLRLLRRRQRKRSLIDLWYNWARAHWFSCLSLSLSLAGKWMCFCRRGGFQGWHGWWVWSHFSALKHSSPSCLDLHRHMKPFFTERFLLAKGFKEDDLWDGLRAEYKRLMDFTACQWDLLMFLALLLWND